MSVSADKDTESVPETEVTAPKSRDRAIEETDAGRSEYTSADQCSLLVCLKAHSITSLELKHTLRVVSLQWTLESSSERQR